MCCIMGYAGHDLLKETFTEYLLRTTSRGPDDQRVAETEFGRRQHLRDHRDPSIGRRDDDAVADWRHANGVAEE